MVKWQTCMGGKMGFEVGKVMGIRIAGTGAVKCSTYYIINQSLEFSCICYFKKKSGIWKMFTDLRAINKVINSQGLYSLEFSCLLYCLNDSLL